ncbi:hypothetical protein BDW22DRAFT_1085652 [Trametopsis cervina]|nr:hypothetical protein BDW22DRAFT_1085652 [Trametopsis cervina]
MLVYDFDLIALFLHKTAQLSSRGRPYLSHPVDNAGVPCHTYRVSRIRREDMAGPTRCETVFGVHTYSMLLVFCDVDHAHWLIALEHPKTCLATPACACVGEMGRDCDTRLPPLGRTGLFSVRAVRPVLDYIPLLLLHEGKSCGPPYHACALCTLHFHERRVFVRRCDGANNCRCVAQYSMQSHFCFFPSQKYRSCGLALSLEHPVHDTARHPPTHISRFRRRDVARQQHTHAPQGSPRPRDYPNRPPTSPAPRQLASPYTGKPNFSSLSHTRSLHSHTKPASGHPLAIEEARLCIRAIRTCERAHGRSSRSRRSHAEKRDTQGSSSATPCGSSRTRGQTCVRTFLFCSVEIAVAVDEVFGCRVRARVTPVSCSCALVVDAESVLMQSRYGRDEMRWFRVKLCHGALRRSRVEIARGVRTYELRYSIQYCTVLYARPLRVRALSDRRRVCLFCYRKGRTGTVCGARTVWLAERTNDAGPGSRSRRVFVFIYKYHRAFG